MYAQILEGCNCCDFFGRFFLENNDYHNWIDRQGEENSENYQSAKIVLENLCVTVNPKNCISFPCTYP